MGKEGRVNRVTYRGRRIGLLTAVKREKFAKVKQSTSKLRLSFSMFSILVFSMFSILVYKFNILPIHSQFAKRFESLLKKFLAFENYELQNCRRHLPT